jgi:hypothetical protein
VSSREIKETDEQFTIFVNPSQNSKNFDGKLDVPISFLNDRRRHEKKFSVPLIAGGEAILTLYLQIVYSYVR